MPEPEQATFEQQREEWERKLARQQWWREYHPEADQQVENLKMAVQALWHRQVDNYGNPQWNTAISLLLKQIDRLEG
jgi:hypothetical protein